MDVLKVKYGKEILTIVNQAAAKFGVEIYAVGGFVRDLYLGTEGTDIDFVVVGDAISFAKSFNEIHSAGTAVIYPRFGTAMVNFKNYKLEFVTARTEHYQENSRKPFVEKGDLKSDLSRRDFTINCLAMNIDPKSFGNLIDIFNGVDDINNKIIRTPLDPTVTFNDDPLRILRAVRFATQLKFEIHEQTLAAIIETNERLNIISQERITAEFNKILLAEKPSSGIDLLKKTGVLKIIFPELDLLEGIDQRQDFHHKDVFYHTLQVVDNIAERTDKMELRLTALLHDIAKPQTKRFIEGIGWTFHGHEEVGACMAERICRRMRYPLNTIKYVKKLVRLHLRPIQLVDENVTDSALRRLAYESGDVLDDLLSLCRADITSKNPEKVRLYLQNFDRVEKRIKEVEEKDKLRAFQPVLTGNDIMKILNIPPGPQVGELKRNIVDAILDGKISNEYEACYNYLMEIKKKSISGLE